MSAEVAQQKRRGNAKKTKHTARLGTHTTTKIREFITGQRQEHCTGIVECVIAHEGKNRVSKYTVHTEAQRGRLMKAVEVLNLERHGWDVTIERHVKGRSLSQNSLYWKWLTIIGNDLGYTPDEVHQNMMPRFLAPKIVTIGGMEREVYTTKGLSTAEFSAYLDNLYRFAVGELGIILPLPEELHERT